MIRWRWEFAGWVIMGVLLVGAIVLTSQANNRAAAEERLEWERQRLKAWDLGLCSMACELQPPAVAMREGTKLRCVCSMDVVREFEAPPP